MVFTYVRIVEKCDTRLLLLASREGSRRQVWGRCDTDDEAAVDLPARVQRLRRRLRRSGADGVGRRHRGRGRARGRRGRRGRERWKRGTIRIARGISCSGAISAGRRRRMWRKRGTSATRSVVPTQREVLRDVMLAAGKYGAWMTLRELARLTRYREASISAQVRHLRRGAGRGGRGVGKAA